MKKIIFLLMAIKAVTTLGATIVTDRTLFFSSVVRGDDVEITTTEWGKTSPLQGFGIYLNNREYSLNRVKITVSGFQADAIRSTGGNNYLYADNLEVKATGYSGDAINLASNNSKTKYTDLVYVKNQSDLSSTTGVTVRANNYYHEDSKSVIILAGSNIIKNLYTSTAANASDSIGYAVYAGNRDRDTNSNVNINAKGKSYVFIGADSIIESNAKKGHAVYANKGGTIQLGNNVEVTANGVGGYALFASREQQSTFTDNIRSGKIYLEGGAKLRAQNSDHVIQAKGEDSVIISGYINTPIIPDSYVRGDEVTIDDDIITASSGRFDIEGNISAVEGGYVSLNMDDNSKIVGSTSIDEGNNSKIDLKISGAGSVWEINHDSSLSTLTLENGATLTPYKVLNGTSILSYTLTGDVKNYGGIINLSSINNNEFDIFTINGNYDGNNGIIIFDTELNGDTSGTDKLVITGNTSGTTKVEVNNVGGSGEETLEGIELISVLGNSNGEFTQNGRIVAGAFDYFLNRGNGITTDNKNWYLTSGLSNPSIDPPLVIPPINLPEEENDLEENQPPVVTTPTYRPESGSYLANNAAVNTLFIHTLHDRLGETQYTDALNNEEKISSIWVRNIGGYNKFRDSSGQLKTTSKRYILQVGGDVAQWSTNGKNRYHLGIMGGHASNHSKTDSDKSGYSSKGDVKGYNIGLYGTWYANKENKTGLYADTWVMYSWFDNEVRGEYLAKEKYSSKGITASLETGYSFKIENDDSHRKTYYIQPKAQVIYMGVKTKDHREANGTVVEHNGEGNMQTRLGVKVYANNFSSTDKEKNREYQPFAELNWIHNKKDFSVVMDDISNKQKGTKDIGEAKIGMEVKINPNLNLWGNIAHQWGGSGYRDSRVTVGLKYSF